MSAKSSKRKSKASTTVVLKDMFLNLRERMGLSEDASDKNAGSMLEALEPRFLLSANPLGDIDDKNTLNNSAALINNDASAIYMPATTEQAESAAVTNQLTASSLRSGASVLSAGPTVEIIHDGGDNIVVGNTVTFYVQATDSVDITSRSLTINSQVMDLDASHSVSYTFTSPGTYKLIAAARNADRVGGTTSLTITVAAQSEAAPTVGITHNGGSSIYTGQQIDFSVSTQTAAASVTIVERTFTINGQTVTLDGNAQASFTFTSAGTYTIEATAKDSNGKIGTSSITIVVLAATVSDTENPVVGITHDAGSSITAGQNVEFTVSATDNIGVTRQEVTINGQAVTLDANGKFSYAFLLFHRNLYHYRHRLGRRRQQRQIHPGS